MVNDQEIHSLAGGQFELRFGWIKLYRPSGLASIGAGHVRQLSEGELHLVMFITENPPDSTEVWATPRKAGELYSEGDYYSIEAKDFSGRVWGASRLLVDFTSLGHSKDDQLWMAEARIAELRGTKDLGFSEPPADTAVEIWYRGSVEFPFTLKVKRTATAGERSLGTSISVAASEFDLDGCFFFVTQENHFLKFSVSSSKPLPRGFDYHVNEALEFLLARRLAWSFVAHRTGSQFDYKITGAPENNSKPGRMHQPVAFSQGGWEDRLAAVQLFQLYLRKVISYGPQGPSPISIAARIALEGNWSPIETHGLQLAVAIEKLLHEEPEPSKATDSVLELELETARGAIKAARISAHMKTRILGKLQDFDNSKSASNRLNRLEKRLRVEAREAKAWRRIRNSTAHGATLKGNVQDFLNDLGSMTTLFYKLIFEKIDYTGPFRDYGQPDWPWQRRSE